MEYIGIDISKETFYAAFPKGKGYTIREYKNNPKGIRTFISSLDKETSHCVMEATGNYCMLLLHMLYSAGIAASLVNPKQTKYFAKMTMSVAKTDARDAVMIAQYGEKMHPKAYDMPSETMLMLKQKRTVLRQLKRQRTALLNVLSSMEVLPKVDKSSAHSIKTVLAVVEKQIRHLEKEICDITEEEFSKQFKLLTSVKGIGVTLATALIIATGGFTYFDNAKQLSRFLGICPTVEQSGTSVRSAGHISKNGDPQLRSMLYIATWSAIKHNQACKECYENLRRRGKPGRVALVAVENKLIRQAFAVVKSNNSFVNGFVSTKP